MQKNPYPGRPYPVGVLQYPTTDVTAPLVESVRKFCLLEYGEPELLIDVPSLLNLGGDYLNLGHGAGGSAMLLAMGLIVNDLRGTVHSIDTFSSKTASDNAKSLQIAQEIVDAHNLSTVVKIYKGRTDKFVDQFNDLSFVFIDADHSYEGVRDDFLMYAPKVRVGGAIAFHDTNQEPSHRVIAELVETDSSWRWIEHVNRIMVFKRVGL